MNEFFGCLKRNWKWNITPFLTLEYGVTQSRENHRAQKRSCKTYCDSGMIVSSMQKFEMMEKAFIFWLMLNYNQNRRNSSYIRLSFFRKSRNFNRKNSKCSSLQSSKKISVKIHENCFKIPKKIIENSKVASFLYPTKSIENSSDSLYQNRLA